MPAELPAPASPARTAERGPLWSVFLVIATAVVVADQLTKAWIVAELRPGETIDVVGELVRLVHSRNTGALFGLFRDQASLFAVMSLGVLALIAWYHRRSARSPFLSVTLGLLLGGAVGNLLDRLRHGYVVDFVDAGIGSLRWYTFNVADAAISFALLFLVLLAVRPELGGPASRGSGGGGGG